MSKFIELHDREGITRLINLDHVEEIQLTSKEDPCIVFFAFNTANGCDRYNQDGFFPLESYDEVKRLVEEATK